MKRTLILSLMLASCLQATLAQNTIESIRKAYQAQKEVIAKMSDNFPSEGIPPEYYHLHVAQNLPGTGPHHENIRMYYDEIKTAEDDIYPPHYLTFTSSRYNFAAREFYEEYLYDQNGQVMFIYARTPDVEFSKIHEFRLYFDGKQLLRLNVREIEDSASTGGTAITPPQHKDIYTGTTIPEPYQDFCSQYKKRAQQFLNLFKTVDENTYQ